MSKLKRLLGALSLVSLFVFSSCVDDEIAPEVTALRQAQVDLLNADVAFRNAQTALQNAQVEFQNLTNSNKAAMDALMQTLTASNNDATIAANDLAIQGSLNALELLVDQHAAALLGAEQTLLQAQADFEQYLATAGLQEAADWLAAWQAIYVGGGTITLPGDPDITVAAGGIVGLSKTIAAKKAEIAGLELLYNATDNIPQSVVIERAQTGVTDAEENVTTLTNLLAAAEAALAGVENPTAELEAQLLALAADSAAQFAVVDSIDMAINAIDEIRNSSDSIVAAFEGIDGTGGLASSHPDFTVTILAKNAIDGDDFDNGNVVTGGADYVTELNAIDADEAAIAAAEANIAVYATYADSLQAAYDRHFPLVSDYEAEIAALEAELATAEADSAAGAGVATEQIANSEAWSDYLIAEAVFLNKGDDNTPADTIAYVQKRNAWDGAARSDIFNLNIGPDGQDVLTDSIASDDGNDGDGGFTLGSNVNADGTYPVRAGWNPTSYAPVGGLEPFAGDRGNPQGGTWATLAAAVATNTAADLPAEIRFELLVTENEYGTAVDEFRTLAATIDSITAGTMEVDLWEDNGYMIGGGFPAASDFLQNANSAFQAYVDDIDSYESILDPIDPATSPDDEAAALAAAQSSLADNQEDLAEEAVLVADYLDAYLGALALLEDVADSIEALKVAPEFALFGAKASYNMIIANMNDVRDAIDNINTKVLALNDDNGVVEEDPVLLDDGTTEYTDAAGLEGLITMLEGTGMGSIQAATDAVFAAEKAVVDAEAGLVTLEDVLAAERLALTVLETELSVLEGFAAEIQALLEAALAG